MDIDQAAIDEWTERNRLAREAYYRDPGPHGPGSYHVRRSEPIHEGLPPLTVRKALERALDDLQRERVKVHRLRRLTTVQTREIIELKRRLGEVTTQGDKVNVFDMQQAG